MNLNGRKTYISLFIALIGIFGISETISPSDVAILIDNIFEIVGILGAIYGRFVTKNN